MSPQPRRWAALAAWRREHPLLALGALALATRLLVLAAAAAGAALLPHHPLSPWTLDDPAWLRGLAKYDSAFYLQMAEEGRVRPEIWAFFPGYPLAIHGLHALAPGLGYAIAGFVIATLSLVAAVPLAYRLTARWFDEPIAWRSAALLVLLPGSFYFTAIYADGLFVALVLATFLALGKRRWLLAGLLASLAGVTRPQGIFLMGVTLLAALLDRARTGAWSWRAFAAAPLSAVLPVVDMFLAYRATGDALYHHHIRSATWPQVSWRDPWTAFTWGLDGVHGVLVKAAFALILLAIVWAILDARRRRLDAPLEAHAWSIGLGVLCFVYSDPAATVRYLLPILSVTWMIAAWARTPARSALVGVASLTALALVAAHFAAGHPFY